jgi:hypothetical protein
LLEHHPKAFATGFHFFKPAQFRLQALHNSFTERELFMNPSSVEWVCNTIQAAGLFALDEG